MVLAREQGPLGGPLAVNAAAPVDGAAVADLDITGLVKGFGPGCRVLDGIDLRVPRGQAVALIGANGAGKSTLLRCCLRLIEPDAGTVRLLGETVTGLGPRRLRRLRARVGFVFQRHNLVPRLSALTNVIHGAQSRHAGPRSGSRAWRPAPCARRRCTAWTVSVLPMPRGSGWTACPAASPSASPLPAS